ncbi:hypothetical protein AN958_08000 [Leucoagaricus sp. SymC.cos]|nr:hypothetical protein AN958_08000 [Leucoagaricus sp. SymC.cos]
METIIAKASSYLFGRGSQDDNPEEAADNRVGSHQALDLVRLPDLGTLQQTAYDDYVRVLLGEGLIFPCIYVTKGFKADNQVYVFIDSDDLSDPSHIHTLADGLANYLPRASPLGPKTSLVLLTKQNPNPRTVEEYQSLFWRLLDGCAKIDKKPWPTEILTTIDDAKWCFCFAGEPFFTVIQIPTHQQRRTRYAKGVTIVFQPKALLAKYDSIPVSLDLKNYDEHDSMEFQQYFLMDENDPAITPYAELSTSVELEQN